PVGGAISRPEPANPPTPQAARMSNDLTPDEVERLEAAVDERPLFMKQERGKELAPPSEDEREVASWPPGAQSALLRPAPEEIAELMSTRGFKHALDNIGGVAGLAEWLRRSRKEHRHRCEACDPLSARQTN